MNETINTIMSRFSCRDFADTPLTGEQIKAITGAALASPSAVNRQPWHVIIITDKALIDELDTEGMNVMRIAEDKSGYERVMSRGGKIFYNAPCMVMVASDGSDWASMAVFSARTLRLPSIQWGLAVLSAAWRGFRSPVLAVMN
jgi:nitroreductase